MPADAFSPVGDGVGRRSNRLSLAARDYEAPRDAATDNDYEVTVKVEDADGNTDTHDVTVTVTDLPTQFTAALRDETGVQVVP